MTTVMFLVARVPADIGYLDHGEGIVGKHQCEQWHRDGAWLSSII